MAEFFMIFYGTNATSIEQWMTVAREGFMYVDVMGIGPQVSMGVNSSASFRAGHCGGQSKCLFTQYNI